MSSRIRHRFVGEIASAGTTSGHRIVVGDWQESPFGAFTDVMHEDDGGHRGLYAPSDAVADYLAATYAFDEVHVVELTSTRLRHRLTVEGGSWNVVFHIGRRTKLGTLLRAVPNQLAAAPWWCAMVDPVARLALRDVRTRGTAGHERVEWYGATDQRRVDAIDATLGGRDLGALADVDPPVRFGFSSVPRTPGIVTLTTTIELDDVVPAA